MVKPTVTELLLDLTRIDSPSGNETAFFDYVEYILHSMKFEIQYDYYGNMIAYRNIRSYKKPILFAFHGDKVSTGEPIKGMIKDGFVISDGKNSIGADNKASLACLIHVLKNRNDEEPIEILLTRMEEEGFIGARNLDRTMIKAEIGITMDGGSIGEITIGSKYWTNILLKSKKDIKDIERWLKNRTTKSDWGITVKSYNNNAYNFSLSILTPESNIDEFIKETCKMLGPDKIKVMRQCPGFDVTNNEKFITFVKDSIKETGIEAKLIFDDIAPEVCVLNSKGIQCVNIGDGVMDEHEVYERVLISDLEKNVAIINKILDNYLHLTPASTLTNGSSPFAG